MYTLLVADDEIFARKGIIKKIQTDPSGISAILEAKDGKEGVAIARYTKIDIVLSDIRMPRMDGIEMCRQIRILYPDCVILFLSGYSDKEYLRSAINIQALQYIDKPVDTGHLTQALSRAVDCCNELRYSRQFIREAAQTRLARYLLTRHAPDGQLPILLSNAECSREAFQDSRSIIFQFLSGLDGTDGKPGFHDSLEECREILFHSFQEAHIPFLLTDYRENNLIVHLLSTPARMISSFSQSYWESLICSISEQLAAYPHFIAAGSIVTSPENLYQSFNTAAICLQSLFYAGINSAAFAEEGSLPSYNPPQELFDSFRQAVHDNDREKCRLLLNNLADSYRSHPGTLVSNTRECFYQLLSWLIGYIRKHTSSEALETETYLWELLHSASTLDELLGITQNYLSLAFNTVDGSSAPSASTQIKQIIIENYKNPDLDIQFISERMNLSVSYLSFLFKQETGLTINHFMNEYRIWKAQELLVSTQLKIADISDCVGYSNQNYFAKTFRKITGTSPSSYRSLNMHKS